MKKHYTLTSIMCGLCAMLFLFPLHAGADIGLAACFKDKAIIKGDILDEKLADKNCIAIGSVQYGATRTVSSPADTKPGDREASAPLFSELTITKNINASTPQLLRYFLTDKTGKGSVEIVIFGYINDVFIQYLSLQLDEVFITGISDAIALGDSLANRESISFNFTKITTKTQTVDENGKVVDASVCYDLSAAITCE